MSWSGWSRTCPPAPLPLVESELPEWRAALETGSAQYALETGQRRIRLLTENLLATQRRDADLERELQELQALNETLELLALVASKTDNGVVILDAQGYVEWINDSFSRMTGFRPRRFAASRWRPCCLTKKPRRTPAANSSGSWKPATA